MKSRFSSFRKIFTGFASLSCVVALSFGASPTRAQDPFRATNKHQIGNKTEAAFDAAFKDGNYVTAANYLKQAAISEPNEPLVYAMEGALAYVNHDTNSLSSYSQKTLQAAQTLVTTDPLRGNLYIAVGHFLQGASDLQNQGTVQGAPAALNQLQQVYAYLDRAEAVSPTDPELNLIRGFMDLEIATFVPFSSPQQAVERLKKYAGPTYLAQRGLAMGLRDLQRYPEALTAVNQAIEAAPSNPELYYLKAQILVKQGESKKNPALFQEALHNFDKATQKQGQLPASLVKQIQRERRLDAQYLKGVRGEG